MFGNKPQPVIKEDKSEINKLKQEHELEVKELKAEHALELKEKDFELRHLKDEQVQKLEKELHEKEIKIAELEKENKMLDRIVDLNGDIIDVKNLVSKLIDKLPQIDLQSLTINQQGK